MKRLAPALLTFLLLLSACAPVPEVTPTPTPEFTPSPTPEITPSPTPEPSQEPAGILYINRELGFTMEIPLSWQGRVVIDTDYTTDTRNGGQYVTVYQKATYEQGLDGPDGALFSIGRYPGQWTEEEPPVYAGGSVLVMETEDFTYFAITPSDVRWVESDAEIQADYADLVSQFSFVWSHISALAPSSALTPSQEPPLTAEELSMPVPDFLTEEQQVLYRRAYSLYVNAFGGYPRNLDAIGVTGPEARLDALGSQPAVTIDGAPYLLSVGRYQNWEDFDRVVHSLFTDRFWNEVNHTEPTSDGDLPRFVPQEDGRLCFLDLEWFQDGSYNKNFPDTFRLEEQTDTSVTFTLIGHYSDIYPRDGETPEDRDARLTRQYDYTVEYPIRLVLTDGGWRFDQFASASTDCEREGVQQTVLHPLSR